MKRGRIKEELSFTYVNPRIASVFHSTLQNELVWVKKHVCMRASRASEYPCCDTVSLLPLLSLSSHPSSLHDCYRSSYCPLLSDLHTGTNNNSKDVRRQGNRLLHRAPELSVGGLADGPRFISYPWVIPIHHDPGGVDECLEREQSVSVFGGLTNSLHTKC